MTLFGLTPASLLMTVNGTISQCYRHCVFIVILLISTNLLNVSVSRALNCLFHFCAGGLCRVLALHLIQCAFTDHCLWMEWASSCVSAICAEKSSYSVPSKTRKTDNQWKETEQMKEKNTINRENEKHRRGLTVAWEEAKKKGSNDKGVAPSPTSKGRWWKGGSREE